MSFEGMDFTAPEAVSFQTSDFGGGLSGINLQAPKSMISEAFSSLASSFDTSEPEIKVAVTPSQMLNGGRLEATAANAARIGLVVK